MTEDERWALICDLDEELLGGGVILSEWCATLVREADIAFAAGAPIAAVLTALAAVETYLREPDPSVERSAEAAGAGGRRVGAQLLINSSNLPPKLMADLHRIRVFRNDWVHVRRPWDDARLLQRPSEMELEADDMARLALRTMRHVLYSTQFV